MNKCSDVDVKVKFLRGFSDKTRIQILNCIMDEEKTVSQIVEEINGNQSNISQHLSCLKGCGIIVGRQEGKYSYYRLSNEKIKGLLLMFDEILQDIKQDVACCDQNDVLLNEWGGR
ncbi:ArsR/SmtB family transcription factor [Paenibacillus dokdonensis]|uniref:ArsR/SmtB family transcription factor n=1 Tax=Paenibacillus dokdonensis TaxID=2567944 RepID=UPI0010A8019A|nr:metalloregulator ArsR/SmtB family transcription factor [Paenibacillus dokdonensis]